MMNRDELRLAAESVALSTMADGGDVPEVVNAIGEAFAADGDDDSELALAYAVAILCDFDVDACRDYAAR